ncbi:uncharacterized protein DUF885 [Kineococcus xinjiangensis]|uniref:Uncharacterized protein DUF885 n=1 Tax=Kineococcus xinjiangensis TaxID=512762 RepID=A0A2S6IST9_9ACTN|nr:DUF885 family protein [Kineococcus xinjiangensis]PPK97231.1 uncharacterized protein DUF885 [Kineococcus xinjiangensis]
MSGGGAPDYPRDPLARRRFQETTASVLRALLDGDPTRRAALAASATPTGPAEVAHSLALPLPDTSPAGLLERERVLVDALEVLDGIDDAGLDVDEAVDLEVLRSDVARQLWQVSELRPAAWDARAHVPDAALRAVLAAPAPAAERAEALLDRLEELPAALVASRDALEQPTTVHGLAALDRITALRAELAAPAVRELLEVAALRAGEVVAAADAALDAHAGWLGGLLALVRRTGPGDPRLGAQRYAAQLWYCLDAEIDPDTLLTRAECDLMEREEELAEEAARYLGRVSPERVPQALAAAAAERAVPAGGAARAVAEEWEALVAEVRAAGWVLLPPGAEHVAPASLLPVVPPDRARLRLELARRGVPGALLLRPAGGASRSATRTALTSACATTGWAECAADFVAGLGEAAAGTAGRAGTGPGEAALRLLRCAERVRAAAEAVVDVRVHCQGAGPEDVHDLLVARAHLDEEEATARWRAGLLDSAVLPVTYVGHGQVAKVLRDLAAARPAWTPAQRHDALLRTGAPPPRHLSALLDLPPDPPDRPLP